jgi:hypothetical protein
MVNQHNGLMESLLFRRENLPTMISGCLTPGHAQIDMRMRRTMLQNMIA